jgi:UTP--glucose-1-phosphate uridylyltransferase
VPQQKTLYEVETILEKPTPSEAEQKLLVPGLRAGHYLCLFGIHVFTAALMNVLTETVERAGLERRVQLTPALAELAVRERYLALEVQGFRYNIGIKYGLLVAQLALALDGDDRDAVLVQLVELLALRRRGRS